MSDALVWAESLIREARRVVSRWDDARRAERINQIQGLMQWMEGKDPTTGKKRINQWDTKTTNSALNKKGRLGAYHRDRHQAQMDIIQEVLQEQGYDQKEAGKWAFLIAGMSASGKTTALQNIFLPDNQEKSVLDRAVTADPDAIKQKIWEHGLGPDREGIRQAYLQDTGVDLGELTPGELASVVHEESSDIAKMLTRQAIKDGKPIIMDNTLTKRGAGEKRVNIAKENGLGLFSALVDIPAEASTGFVGQRYINGRDLWDEMSSQLPDGFRAPGKNIRNQLPEDLRKIYDAQFARAIPASYTGASAPNTPGRLSMASEVWADEVDPYSLASWHFTPEVFPDETDPAGYRRGKGEDVQARTTPGPMALKPSPAMPAAPVPVLASRVTAMDQPPQDIHEAFEAFERGQLAYEDLLYAVGCLPPPEWSTEGDREEYPDVFSYVEDNPYDRPDADSDILALVLAGAIDRNQAGDLYDAIYANPAVDDMDPDAELGF